MIYYIITLCILLINIIINNSINRRILYPPTLFSIIWLVVLSLHMIAAVTNYLGIQLISIYSLIIFTIGPCVFTLGGYLGYLSSINRSSYSRDELYINKKFLNFLMILTALLLPLYAYESYQIVMANSITGDFMRDLRLNLNTGEATRKYVYGIIFSFFSFFINFYLYLIKSKYATKKKLFISIVLLLLYIILSTGRTTFLQLFILILASISMVKKLKIKYIINSILGFILLFFTYGFLLQKGTNENANFSDNLTSMFDNFSIYFLGGISAFDYKMINGFNNYGGELSFRFPIAILNKIGIIDSKPQELVEEYVSVPFETNVYTIYQVYMEDFGIYYMVFSMFMISFLLSKIYSKSISKNIYRLQYIYIYSLLLFPIVMSFFQDQFITLLATWFYAFILVLISMKFIYYKKI